MLEDFVEEEDHEVERQQGRASNTSAGSEEGCRPGKRKTVHFRSRDSPMGHFGCPFFDHQRHYL